MHCADYCLKHFKLVLVLASYGNDGSRQILDDFREAYYWLWQVDHPISHIFNRVVPDTNNFAGYLAK